MEKDPSSSIVAEAKRQGLPHIPEDLVLKILKYLPPKQLVKCKCLSKSLLSEIEAPDFFLNSGGNNNQLVGLAGESFITKLDFVRKSRGDFPLRFDLDFTRPHLVSSFHGVVCTVYSIMDAYEMEDDDVHEFFEQFHVVSLWNPATGDVKVLPPPLFEAKLVNHYHYYYVDFGFGFHAETNDYRVVRVVQDADGDLDIVEVYSLKTDSWRVIDVEVPKRFEMRSDSKRPLEGGGLYYWLGEGCLQQHPPLVAFNFNTEDFEEIPMTDVFGTKTLESYHGELAVLKEKLAYIHRLFRGNTESRYDIWVLTKHGREVSWKKQHTISLRPYLRPICFSDDGMMVIGKAPEHTNSSNSSILYLFDPDSMGELHVTPFTCTFSMAAVYKESVVSISGANGVTYRLDTKWRPNPSWKQLLSQTIKAVNKIFASRFRRNGMDLMIFDLNRM